MARLPWRQDPRGMALEPLPEQLFVTLDTETTGLNPRADLPVAVAAVPFVAGQPMVGDGFQTLVNPGRPIPATAHRIHGISDAMIRHAPAPTAVLPGLLQYCHAQPALIGFHIGFDLAILNRLARRMGLPPLHVPALDVAELAAGLSPHWAGLTLEQLAGRLQIPIAGRHTAAGDAILAGRIYLRLVPVLKAYGVDHLGAALRLQRGGPDLFHGGPGHPGA